MQSPKLFAQDGNEYREFTQAEYEQHATDLIEYERQNALALEKAAARKTLLDRLGITENEAALLLG
jgi:hypothetical protein